MIAERYGVPEHEALAYAFIGIDEYFRRRAELEKDIQEKEEQLKAVEQKLNHRLKGGSRVRMANFENRAGDLQKL